MPGVKCFAMRTCTEVAEGKSREMQTGPTYVKSADLIGTWKLVSAISTSGPAEAPLTPYGENASGVLTYTPEGYVTALISYSGRKPLSLGGGTHDEQAEAFRTFLAYAGRYSIDDDKVIHHVQISSIQNYVGRSLVRIVRHSGNRIVLVTPPTPVNGKVQTIELTWERVAADQ